MTTPITVNYTRDGDDWKLTVSRDEKSLAGHAPGLIAARDRADQLVEKLAPKEDKKVVVHLLDGDAFAFTTEYLAARLAKPAPAATEATPEKPADTASTSAADAKTKSADAAKPVGAAEQKSATGSHRAPQEDKQGAKADATPVQQQAVNAANAPAEPDSKGAADPTAALDSKASADEKDGAEQSAEGATGSVSARLSDAATNRIAN